MRRLGHVYLFVRAPRVGGVKRRLAADIGTLAAWRFYRETMQTLLGRLAADHRWQTWLAVTPDRFAGKGRFWPRGIPRVPQGAGDLGDRMRRALCRVPGMPAIIVGSDIPELDAHHVADAFGALRSRDAVVGPSTDGGYWLVGTRDARVHRDLFDDVRWSTQHALADTLAGFHPRRCVARLHTLEDIDDGAAFTRWRARQRSRLGSG